LKITILQGAFLPVPPLRGGAVEKLWFQFGKIFQESGHFVSHISRSYPGLPSEQIISGVHHIRASGFDMPTNSLLVKLFDLLYSIRALFSLPHADILVTNTFWMPLLLFLGSHARGRIVVSVERMPKGQMRFYRHVAILRCCSSAVRDRLLQEAPFLAKKTVVIANPLPFQLADSSYQYSKQNIILYCGRLHPEKGLNLLIRAYFMACHQGLQGWSLHLIGPFDVSAGGGGFAWFRELQALASSGPGFIRFLGPIFDDQKLHAEYQKASIFAYPSLAESGEAMGLAPLEAMAFGAVPLVSSLACFTDFIEHGSNGVVFDHRSQDPVSALSLSLLSLASDPLRLHRLSREALLVRQTHHPRRIAQQMLDCFRDICPSDTNAVL
jgi:glycosyltransferase involved in cell wall biosynthesis